MKPPSRFAVPPLDSSARLPIGLALILLAALAFQLAVPDSAAPAAAAPIASRRTATAPLPAMPPSPVDPAIVARMLFAPRASSLAATGAAPAGPLGGYALIGAVRVGRRAYAVVRTPEGGIERTGIGGRIGDWQLRGLSDAGALLMRGSEQLRVPFGTAPTATPPAPGGSMEGSRS